MATGPRRTAGTRGADMAEEEGVIEGREPEGGQAGGEGAVGGTDWKAMARKWERLGLGAVPI